MRYYNHISHDDLLRAALALQKFCRDHQYPEGGLTQLNKCVNPLKADDFKSAVNYFKAIPLGGNGCFNDWFPPVVYDHETPDYVWVVFDSLLERTVRLMQKASDDGLVPKNSKWSFLRRFIK